MGERDNHIAIVEPSASMKNYSRCITGAMKMAPGAILNPGRVPAQELQSPELGFLVAAELGCVSREKLR